MFSTFVQIQKFKICFACPKLWTFMQLFSYINWLFRFFPLLYVTHKSVESPFFLMVVLLTVHSSMLPHAHAICVVPIAARSCDSCLIVNSTFFSTLAIVTIYKCSTPLTIECLSSAFGLHDLLMKRALLPYVRVSTHTSVLSLCNL